MGGSAVAVPVRGDAGAGAGAGPRSAAPSSRCPGDVPAAVAVPGRRTRVPGAGRPVPRPGPTESSRRCGAFVPSRPVPPPNLFSSWFSFK